MGAHDAGGRAGEDGFHRRFHGKGRLDQGAVSLDHHQGRLDPAFGEQAQDGAHELLQLGNEPEIEGDCWLTLANGCASMGDRAGAVTNTLYALKAYQTAFGDEHVKTALTLYRLAKFQNANKQKFESLTNAELAIAVARKFDNQDLIGRCLLDAGKLFTDSPRTPEGIGFLREAIHHFKHESPNLMACIDSTRSLVKALQSYAAQGHQDEAEAILREELDKAPKDGDLLKLLRNFTGDPSAQPGQQSEPH